MKNLIGINRINGLLIRKSILRKLRKKDEFWDVFFKITTKDNCKQTIKPTLINIKQDSNSPFLTAMRTMEDHLATRPQKCKNRSMKKHQDKIDLGK
jgi:ribosomal protein S3AE